MIIPNMLSKEIDVKENWHNGLNKILVELHRDSDFPFMIIGNDEGDIMEIGVDIYEKVYTNAKLYEIYSIIKNNITKQELIDLGFQICK